MLYTEAEVAEVRSLIAEARTYGIIIPDILESDKRKEYIRLFRRIAKIADVAHARQGQYIGPDPVGEEKKQNAEIEQQIGRENLDFVDLYILCLKIWASGICLECDRKVKCGPGCPLDKKVYDEGEER